MHISILQSKVYVNLEALPSSIEAYLSEAGFSGTEIIVLKKLLEEDALTLRELAAKTGKSTGVLDQAVKKLLKKRILSRETINDTPKYVLKSLNSILEWMEEDTKLKQQMMQRRHENFESFVRSLTVGKKRPEMEYFEGLEGLKRAYTQLLERGNDIVQYGPIVYLAEEDPLRDFRVQWFRERRNKGIFSRVITHNTPLGRRFQSRDVFEYRKTILVDPDAYSFAFEKVITGDTVACFQLEEERACFIKYPELAQEERSFFERLWNKKIEPAAHEEYVPTTQENYVPPRSAVPLKTKTLSQLREFFLSRTSLVAMFFCALLAAIITYSLYRENTVQATRRIQEKVQSIGATGALQFDAVDLNDIRTAEDINNPNYAKVIYILNQIRNQNEGIKFAYILRPTNKPDMWEWVADSDSLNPNVKIDLNNDGMIDERDHLSFPGESYDVSGQDIQKALYKPAVSQEPYTDQWGTWISGWAPIRDADGNVVAVFGVDVEAESIKTFSQSNITPLLSFAALFLLFVLIRLAAFNRSLLQELFETIHAKKGKLLLVGGLLASASVSIAVYISQINTDIQQAREKLLAIASTGAMQFSAQELNQYHVLDDVRKPAYKDTIYKLHNILTQNSNIKYAYIIRPLKGTTTFEFIADADAYGIDIFKVQDIDNNGAIDSSDDIPYPGLSYDIGHIDILRKENYHRSIVTEKPYTDKWGTVLTGYAPIMDDDGSIAGVLAVDVNAGKFYWPGFTVFVPLILYVTAVAGYVLFGTKTYKQSLLFNFVRRILTKKFLLVALFILMTFYWLVFGLYFYTLHLIKEETGKRLLSIVVTAVSQIDPDDLENLRFARDMKSEEYQRVFTQLNDIRNKNTDITYAFILRPTEVDGIWEFVADADSNHYIPNVFLDYNKDNEVNEADENVAPGVQYDITYSYPEMHRDGFQSARYEYGPEDQWGASMSARAPILSNDGKPVGILGIDKSIVFIDDGILKQLKTSIYSIYLIIIILFALFLRERYKINNDT